MNKEIARGFFDKLAKMEALPHQERIVEKLKKSEGVLAYHGLGSGKTFAAIHSAEKLGLPLLAIVPASLRENFKKEISKAGFKGDYKVVSYEEATNLSDNDDFKGFASRALVVYDEAHRMGRSGSQRSQLPKKIPSKKSLLLTGTPLRNRPTELAPLLEGIKAKNIPKDPRDFKERFVGEEMAFPGFWATLMGRDPIKEPRAKNLSLLTKYLQGMVDYHEGGERQYYPGVNEEVLKVQMTPKQHATYEMMMSQAPGLAYKVEHGLPPDKKEVGKMQSFLIGPRLIANTPVEYNLSAKDEDAAKVVRAANEIENRYKKDPNFRGVSYSAFLASGIYPLARELKKRNIPYIEFTGKMNDKQKKQAVHEYNRGDKPVLLVSGAGAEGLDLKGTKLMQILEPHWNDELIEQVKGRAIRYKSHEHLPENERAVTVQRFQATVPPSIKRKVKNKIYETLGLEPSKGFSADEYLDKLSKTKKQLNDQFLHALQSIK